MIELYRLKKKKKKERVYGKRKKRKRKKKPSKTKIVGQLCPPLLWEAARKGGAGRSLAKVKMI